MKKNNMILLLFSVLLFFSFPVYANPSELSNNEKAEIFNEVMAIPIWHETTVNLTGRTLDKARDIAILSSKIMVRQMFRDRIVKTEELKLTKDMIDFTDLAKVTEEDTSGNYGRPYEVEKDNINILNVTFRFKFECDKQKIRDVNPFIEKNHNNKNSFIREFKENNYYWEIIAVGYGFYESFEDIDSKIRISSKLGVENACQEIIKKVAELGITDQDVQGKIINAIKAKKNYGGVYRVLGCGVEVEKPIPIRINKKDFTVSFIYN
ncbi:hypothetical protein SRRS_14990 [Sporomusa rhizae]|uniref:hypothetical protein n=1 Tax=Sporomusa rhizae TaxID=357999 RepID=UPI00352A3EBF